MMKQFEVFHMRDGQVLLTQLVDDFDRFWGFRRVVRSLNGQP